MSVPSSGATPPPPPPHPLSRKRVCPCSPLPPRNQRGGGHTRLRGWGGACSDDWRKSLALCLLCGLSPRLNERHDGWNHTTLQSAAKLRKEDWTAGFLPFDFLPICFESLSNLHFELHTTTVCVSCVSLKYRRWYETHVKNALEHQSWPYTPPPG